MNSITCKIRNIGVIIQVPEFTIIVLYSADMNIIRTIVRTLLELLNSAQVP